MTTPPFDPVDDFIDALRADLPPPEADAAMRQRLRAAGLAIPAASVTAASVPALGAAAKLWAPSMAAKLGLASVLVIGTPAAVILGARRGTDAGPRDVDAATESAPELDRGVIARASAPAAAPEHAEPSPRVVTPEDAPPPPSTASRPERKAARDPKAQVTDASTLREETELIARGLAALEAGEFEAAAQALQTHAQRFPHGLLKRERERTQRRLDRSLNQTPME